MAAMKETDCTEFFSGKDPIQKAIEKGYNCSTLINQTWDDCQANIGYKKVVIYGLGNGTASFIRDYGLKISIDHAIDNRQAGRSLADYWYISQDLFMNNERDSLSNKSLIVESEVVLDTMNPDETAIIILSLVRYQEIYNKLVAKGFKYVYSYLCMEANKRKNTHQLYKDAKKEFIYGCTKLDINRDIIAVQTIGGYCDHARQIVEKLKEINPRFVFVWIVPNNINYEYEFPWGSRIVRQGTPDYYRVMATAKLWLFEDPIFPEFPKKKGQICVQLKHWASVTLKAFGHPLTVRMKNYNEEIDKKLWEYNNEITDCYIVGSEFDERTVREGFLYSGECFHAGSPRSDLLFNDVDYKSVICGKYEISCDYKLCLYAPTFRFDQDLECAYDDVLLNFYLLKSSLELKFGGGWKILLRLHPRIQDEKKSINSLPDFVIDVSKYMDSEELVAASDLMVADYSSIIFEPAFINRPVFLYAPDLEKYLREERSFLIDYNELPFPIARNNDELAENIINFDKEKYVTCLEAFFEEYGVHEDGHASERAAKFILELMG